MKIKNKENKPYFTPIIKKITKKSFDIFKKKKKIVLFSCLILCISLIIIFSIYIQSETNASSIIKKISNKLKISYNTQLIFQGILHENIHIIPNYINGWFSTPEKISIDIKFEDYQKLHNKCPNCKNRDIEQTTMPIFDSMNN